MVHKSWQGPLMYQAWISVISIVSSLRLLSAFAVIDDALDPSPYVTKFGCNWYAPGSKNDVDSKTEKYTNIAPDAPIFGRLPEPMILSDEKELDIFIRRFTEVYKDVMSKYPYNSFDKFLRFYRDYKGTVADFKTFFRNYRPAYHPRTTCTSLNIEIFDQAHYKLKDRWPQLADYTYLAAARSYISPKWEENLKETFRDMSSKTGVDYALMTKGINSVLGCIRIKVGDREGYILTIIGTFWDRPCVVMYDGLPPHDAFRQDINKADEDNLSLVLNNTHVIWKVTPTDPSRASHAATNLVLLSCPYCSFVETTEKEGLLKKLYPIAHRDRNGKQWAAMYFSLKDVNREVEIVFRRRFNFFNLFERAMDYRQPISFFRLTNKHNLPDSNVDWWIKMVAQVFGCPEEDIVKRLQILYGDLQDKVFVKSIFDMHDEVAKRNGEDTKYEILDVDKDVWGKVGHNVNILQNIISYLLLYIVPFT